jgi:hypothetical protein
MAGTILRKSYTAHRKSKVIRIKASKSHKSYTRRLSKKSIRVKASRIKDQGKPGKGPKLWTVKKGGLSKYGYSSKDGMSTRHAALQKAIKAEGPNVIQKRLIAVSNYNKITSPTTHRVMRSDIEWIHKKYFT